MSRPAPRLDFDLRLQVSPFTVARRLAEGPELVLIDLRGSAAGGPAELAGARPWPGPDWRPPADLDVVLVDDDGSAALVLARRLHRAGHPRVRALFGGARLYDFALGEAGC